jgi:hypothetical protein
LIQCLTRSALGVAPASAAGGWAMLVIEEPLRGA